MQKDGYIIAKADKIFEVLSDITNNKEQRTMDEFRPQKGKGYKNVDKNISPEYEEEEEKSEDLYFASKEHQDDQAFDGMEMSHHQTIVLNEVNESNIEKWCELLKKSVDDLTLLSKKEKSSQLSLEDLASAFKRILRIKDRFAKIKLDNAYRKEDEEGLPSLMQIKKASELSRSGKKSKQPRNISEDFYM